MKFIINKTFSSLPILVNFSNLLLVQFLFINVPYSFAHTPLEQTIQRLAFHSFSSPQLE